MNIEALANDYFVSIEKDAAAKSKKKVDPKAKVRNRGLVVFPAESKNVKDKKDHFPINDAKQARNAWARAHQYDAVPPWYKGTLKSLQEAVRRKVRKEYPSIEFASDRKKSASLNKEAILKESLDSMINDTMMKLHHLARFIGASVETLTDLKNTYHLEFNPMLEEDMINGLRAMNMELNNAGRMLKGVHKKASELSAISHTSKTV